MHRPAGNWLSVAVALGLTVTACGRKEAVPVAADTPVIERTTDGNVRTVRNVSGSTWGAPAYLVEELSIGVLEGAEEYMLGQVASIWATDDRVYVIDTQVPVVRVYDHNGQHVADVGRTGQGPGEYGARPGTVVVLSDGTVVLNDQGNERLVFFGRDHDPLRTWSSEEGHVFDLRPTNDGTLLAGLGLMPEAPAGNVFELTAAVATIGAGPEFTDLRLVPTFDLEDQLIVVETGGRARMGLSGRMLLRPAVSWTVRPDGAIVAGASDHYRFEVHSADGAVLSVERLADPVPVSAAEAAYVVRQVEGQVRRMAPDWVYTGRPVATHKPYYVDIRTDIDSRIWVERQGPSVPQTDCVEDPREDGTASLRRPCWKAPTILEVFDPEGAYLGEVRRPDDLTFEATFVNGDEYWAAVEDTDGLVTVRRFRIVTPADN